MIREYDQIHATLARVVEELENKNSRGLSKENEEFLLNKISGLETEKNQKEENLKKIELENSQLKSRVQSLNELKIEFETKSAEIADRQSAKFESLSQENSNLKARLAETQKENEDLKLENESAYNSLQKMEQEKSQQNLENSQEFEKSSLKNSQLEKMLTKQKALTKQIESGLDRKSEEVKRLVSRMNEYHKKYNLVAQLNKSSESNIRALKNENRELTEKLETLNGSFRKMEEGFRKVAIELKSEDQNAEIIEGTIREFFDIREIDLICNENLSVDSMIDEELEINRSLEEVEEEFRGKEEIFDTHKIRSMEIELNELSNLDCSEMDKLVQFSRTLNNSGNAQEKEITSSRTHKILNMDEVFGKEPKLGLPLLNKREIQSQIEEKIESNIQRRSLKKGKSFRFGLDEKMFNSGKTEFKVEEIESGKLLQELKIVAKERIGKICEEVLGENEKNEVSSELEMSENVRDFVIWTFKLFEEKLKNRKSQLNALESEKKSVEFALAQKKEELANLHKNFIQRNKDYETLLNETIKVNTQLFKNRQKKIKEMKKRSQKKSPSKKEESGFFSFIKKSLMPESETKKSQKSQKSSTIKSKKKNKASFVISKEFVKKNSGSRFEDNLGPIESVNGQKKVDRDPFKNLKFVEDMANIQKNLGPNPIFEYNSEISSLRNILKEKQNKRSSILKSFLSGNSLDTLEEIQKSTADEPAKENSTVSVTSVEDFLQKKKIEISKRKKNKYFFKKLDKMFG